MLLATRKGEPVSQRKRLQERRFPECDGSVLRRVKESSLGGIVAAAGNGRGNVTPCHSAVDVKEAVDALVTPETKTRRHVRAAAAILWDEPD
jgi:hypothetical protein